MALQIMTELQDGVFPVMPEDYPRVVEVWEASVRATHHFVAESDIEIFRPIVREVLAQIPSLFCVRDKKSIVAGYIAVAQQKIEMLFIHPDWRGKGIGRQLVQYAVGHLDAKTLDVNEQNEQAVGFYLRMGFEVIGRSDLDGMGKPYPLLHLRHANYSA
jgi:putative acetyltransferase